MHRNQDLGSPDARAVAIISQGDEFELSNSAPDVINDIVSCIEQIKVEESNHLVGPNVPSSLRSSVSLQRRHRRQMSAARLKSSVMSLSDT